MKSNLQELVSNFGAILRYAERHLVARNSSTLALCQLFGTKSAYLIRACIGELCGDGFEPALRFYMAGNRYKTQVALPTSEEAKAPARKLFAEAALADKTEIIRALDGMGLLSLCPLPEEQFTRMEYIAEQVTGPSRLIFLVELSFFAAELEDYGRATKYASEAHNFDPVAWQLYNLRMIEGLAALDAGRSDEAIKHLAKSIDACLTDVRTCLECGLSPPNFLLVAKLLDRGERVEVLRHLLECKSVWRMLRPHIELWISAIESEGRPDFIATEGGRLVTQGRNIQLIESGQVPGRAPKPQSRGQVIAEVENLRADFRLPDNVALPKPVNTDWPGPE